MKRFALTVIAILIASQASAATALYASYAWSNSQLYKLNPANGAITSSLNFFSAGGVASVQDSFGMAKNPIDGFVYGIFGYNSYQDRRLCRVNLITGELTWIGPATDRYYAGMAFSSDGTLFVVTGGSGNLPRSLFVMNPSNGSAVKVKDLSSHGSNGMAFCFNASTGLLYHACGSSNFWSIDPLTLVDTYISPSAGLNNSMSMTDAGGNLMYYTDRGAQFYTLSTTGTLTYLGSNNYMKGMVVDTDNAFATPTPSATPSVPTATPAPTPSTPLYALERSGVLHKWVGGSEVQSINLYVTSTADTLGRTFALARQPGTGVWYTAFTYSSNNTEPRFLGTVDHYTGKITQIGKLNDHITDLAFSQSGVLYASTGYDGNQDALSTVNLATAVLTQVADFAEGDGGTYGVSIAFNTDNGLVYHFAHDDPLYVKVYDPADSSILPYVVPYSGSELHAVTYYGSGSFLFSTSGNECYQLTTAGDMTNLFSFGYDVHGLLFDFDYNFTTPTVTPSPTGTPTVTVSATATITAPGTFTESPTPTGTRTRTPNRTIVPTPATMALYASAPWNNSLKRISPLDGSDIESQPMTASDGSLVYGLTGMARHPGTQEIYVAFQVGTGSSVRRLGKINLATGYITVIGNSYKWLSGLAFDSANVLWSISGNNGGPANTLGTVNLSTAAFTGLLDLEGAGLGQGGWSLGFNQSNGRLVVFGGGGDGDPTDHGAYINPSGLAITPITASGDDAFAEESASYTYYTAGNAYYTTRSSDQLYTMTSAGEYFYLGSTSDSFKALVLAPVMSFATPTLTFTESPTPNGTLTNTPTRTPFPSSTNTPGPSNTRTGTKTGTITPSFTSTPTTSETFSATPTWSDSPTPTMSPTITETFTVSKTSTETKTVTPTPTETQTFTVSPTQTETFTVSPTIGYSVSTVGDVKLGPIPAQQGKPICLSYESQPVSSSVELFNSRFERVASATFDSSLKACVETGGLAPGIYYARLKAKLATGDKDGWQKIIIVGR